MQKTRSSHFSAPYAMGRQHNGQIGEFLASFLAEALLGLWFPGGGGNILVHFAFFVNTGAAQVLYSALHEEVTVHFTIRYKTTHYTKLN